MKETPNLETHKKRSWAIVYKASLIGGVIGGLVTIAIIVFAFSTGGLPILILSALPTIFFLKPFGYNSPALYGDNVNLIALVILPFFVNSFLFSIIGMVIGLLFKTFKKKQ
jgi:hypothetical protein